MKPTAENIEHQDRSFVSYEFQSVEFEQPYHFHHETELVFINKGKGEVLIGNATSPYEPGDIFIIGSDIPHRFFTSKEADSRELNSYILQFNPDCFGNLFNSTPELLRICKLINQSKHGLLIRSAPVTFFNNMRELLKSDGIDSVIKFLSLLADIDKYGQKEFISKQISSELEVQAETKISAIIDWINKNYRRDISLDDIAQRTNMNKNAFCRAFKNHTGQTPMNYINVKRVDAASKLLMESGKGIADIGFMVGFPTVSSFNRNFKKIRGVSPNLYRKMTEVFTNT